MINEAKLADNELDKVAGGSFGPTQHTIEVKARNFDTFIHSARKVIILIGAGWCTPSKITALALEDFAANKGDSTLVGTMDVDDPDNDQLMQRLNVTSIPTILKYEDGNLKEHTIGAVKRENLRKMIF